LKSVTLYVKIRKIKLLEAKPSLIHNFILKQYDISNIHVSVGNVLWVVFSIPPGSLSLVKYPEFSYIPLFRLYASGNEHERMLLNDLANTHVFFVSGQIQKIFLLGNT
jgi:hypothetical protein